MPKFAYVLEIGTIYRYSVQPDGSLSSLGAPVQCDNALYMAFANASQFPDGGDYLFLVGSAGISVYHVENDGSLTLKIEHYTDGVGPSPQNIAALWWNGSNDYFVYVANNGVTASQISGYRFSPASSPNPIVYLGDPATNFSPTNAILGLDVVAAPGAGQPPVSSFPYIYAVYTQYNGPAATDVISFGTSSSGSIDFISAVIINNSGGAP